MDARDAEDRSNEAPEPDALTSLLFAGSQRGTLAIVPDPLARGHPAEQAPLEAHARRRKSRWARNVEGFSVHAGTAVTAGNRVGLEQLLRYCARPSVSLDGERNNAVVLRDVLEEMVRRRAVAAETHARP
jgi:hypothetical protein